MSPTAEQALNEVAEVLGLVEPTHTRQERVVGWIDGPLAYAVDVVGESKYQENIRKICGGHTYEGVNHDCTAAIIWEDNNPHDAKAVRIDIEGVTVGYLSREIARQYVSIGGDLESKGYMASYVSARHLSSAVGIVAVTMLGISV